MIGYCITPDCTNPVENKTTGLCASCGHAKRKEERVASKEKKVYKIRKVSKKHAKELKTYSQVREEYLKRHPFCEIRLLGCTSRATDIHHVGKRGLNLSDPSTFKAACRSCHTILETKLSAAERREKGLLK